MDSLRDCELKSLNSTLGDREVFTLQGVAIKVIPDEFCQETENGFINGRLSLVEKADGISVEWCRIDEDGWVLTNVDDVDTTSFITRLSESSEPKTDPNSMKLSVHISELQSFQCIEPKNECSWIRFNGLNDVQYPQLYFRQGGLSSFFEHLQRYTTLKRSARQPNLILLTNDRIEALEQSVSILNINGELFTHMFAQPYASAMNGLGKMADFVQDRVIAQLLDSDSLNVEEQLKAIQEFREQQEEAAARLRLHNDAGFELVTQLDLPQRAEFSREKPLTEEAWLRHKNSNGSFKNVRSLKVLIFRGGLMPSLRKEAWNRLLGVYEWNATTADIVTIRKRREEDYYRMKLQWKTINEDQESRFSGFASRRTLIAKDVVRTDRAHSFYGGNDNVNVNMLNDILMTYCMYNFDLGYVQGMSDYLSPLLVVMQNEVDTFWAFVALMNRVHGNFEMDQAHMKKQLSHLRDLLMIVNPKLANYLEMQQTDEMYFCFRWLLVSFKREFSFDDIMKLWEVLWTDLPCKNFELLMCVAILDIQAAFIMDNKFGLTEILKHINDLAMNIDVDETLASAEAIYHQLAATKHLLPQRLCDILGLSSSDIND